MPTSDLRCILNGQHSSAEHAAECPLLGRSKRERLERWQAQQEAKTNA